MKTSTLNYWDWNKFTGLADTNTIGSQGQYDNESYNIDTQTEPNGVKLTPAPQEYHTTTDNPTVILNLSDYGKTGILTCTADGKVYRNGALIYTLSSGNEIYDAIGQYNSIDDFYVLLFTRDAIHRMKLSDPVGVDINWKAFVGDSSKKTPVNVYGDIYFASKNKWYKLDTAGTLSSSYTFPKQDTVVGITFFQDNFNIYTTGGNNGRQYLFPILSETPYYNIPWNGLPILGVTSLGGIDYVVTGYNRYYSDLYLVSGTQRKLLKVNNEGVGVRGFNGVIFSRLNDIYLGGIQGHSKILFKYGSYYNGFSQELMPFELFTNDVTCLGSGTNIVYIGTNDNKVSTINLNSVPNNYNTTGEITSMILDFGTPDTRKSLQGVDITYSNKSTNISSRGGTLTLYARKDETNSWTEIKTTGSKSDIGKVRVDATEIRDLNFGDFYQIQFKVKLEGSGSSTPFLKKVKVIYQDNLQS